MTILGVYWAPGHQRPSDIDYMRRLQPPAIRVLDPDVNQIAIAYQSSPGSLILPRDWALSEQHDDVQRDPVGTGKRHARDWREKVNRWRSQGAALPPDDRIIVVGINEPKVWEMLPQVVEYTVAWLDECTALGLRACALNLSVGWPANTGPDTPPDWSPYAPIEAAIQRGHHFLVLHEYWYRTGPRDGWGWYAGRLQHCPWDVPIIIGECGIDMYVDMQRWTNDGRPNRGWRGNVDGSTYAQQIEDYARAIDTRVVAILPFLTDYRSNNWESFDTAEAHPALLSRASNMVPQAKPPASKPDVPPSTVHLPSVGTGGKTTTAYVNAPAGLNIREQPVTGDVITAVPYGEAVTVLDHDDDAAWVPVRYEGVTGWMYAGLLTDSKPEPLPVDEPDQLWEPPRLGDEKWHRIYPFIRRWEGGWADHPDDPGGATMKGITLGTYARWREAHGQPRPTKDDLRRIPDAEVEQILYEEYYLASGADKLPWPLALPHADTAVNGGVERAEEMLAKSGGDFVAYMGHLIHWYTRIDNFEHFGRAWIRRRAEILLEASK